MPPAKNLTPKLLNALKPKSARYELLDKTGLVVRIEPTGKITFYSHYRLHKQRRLLKHGEYDAMSLTEAREAHTQTMTKVEAARRGVDDAKDPAVERDIRRAEAASGDTVMSFAELYVERYAKPKKRSWRADQRILEKDVVPIIGSYKLRHLTRANIQAVLDPIEKRGSSNQAWQTLKVVRKMLNYAVARGSLETNPAVGIELEVTYTAKQRALSDKELEGLFKALPELKLQVRVRDLLLFQLYTAVRPSEAREANWDEIDFRAFRWTIPEGRMKMKKEHLVPLTPPAVEILERMRSFGKSGYVFKGEKDGMPFNLQVLGHALRREENQRILKLHGVKPFQPHDVRRTSATIMRRLGYGLVVDRVLAHVPTSVTDKHYDVHDYEPEKGMALEGLAKFLQAIEAKARGENVELLSSRRRNGAA